MTKEEAKANYLNNTNGSFGDIFDEGYDAGYTACEGELDAFINWWHRDYRLYPGYGFMLKSDGRKPFIEVEYLTTAQLLDIYRNEQKITK